MCPNRIAYTCINFFPGCYPYYVETGDEQKDMHTRYASHLTMTTLFSLLSIIVVSPQAILTSAKAKL